MKRINKIDSSDFYKMRRSLPYPSVSLINDTETTYYQTKSGVSPNVGDIVLWDKEESRQVLVYYTNYNATDYPLDRYTPIGVVVIPQDFCAGGHARMMSLVNMSCETPDKGTTSNEYIYWGGYGDDIEELHNFGYDYIYFVDSDGQQDNTTASYYGYLPSDKFSTVKDNIDSEVSWYYDDSDIHRRISSPYDKEWNKNANYGLNSNGEVGAVLSDQNGKSNTDIILSKCVYQPDWRTDESIINDYGSGQYPAAMCCWRFSTEGTKQGDWYLPAMGELAFLMPRWKIIQNALGAVAKVYRVAVRLDEDYYFWSSSEVYSYSAYYLYTYGGYVYYYDKLNDFLVRSFCALPRI